MKRFILFMAVGSICLATDIHVKLDANQVKLSEEWAGKVKYHRLPDIKSARQSEKGLPGILRLHKWIAIDPQKTYSIEVIPFEDATTIDDILLYPAQPDVIDTGVIPTFHKDHKAYRSDHWFGGEIAQFEKAGKIGSVTLVGIEITPISYNPKLKTLRIISEFTVRVTPHEPGPETFFNSRNSLSPFVLEQIEQLVENGSVILSKARRANARRVMIITTAQLKASAEKLVQLQESMTIQTSLETIEAGLTPEAVKEVITKNYQLRAFDAVLLYGDVELIPLYNWDYNPGDVYYSLISGDDNIADIAIGRIPVATNEDGLFILEKSRKFIENIATGLTRKNVMLVAHGEEYPGKYTANQEEIFKAPNTLALKFTRQYGGKDATNASVIKSTSNQFGIINYRGHGSSTEWWAWDTKGDSFTENEIDQLKNDHKGLAIYFNIACDTGAIHESQKTLSESMLLRPSQKPYEGAVAVVASTQPSYTEMNHRFDKYLFESMQKSNASPLGNIYMMANNRLVQDEGGEMPENVKMYLLLGHPLLPMPYQEKLY